MSLKDPSIIKPYMTTTTISKGETSVKIAEGGGISPVSIRKIESVRFNNSLNTGDAALTITLYGKFSNQSSLQTIEIMTFNLAAYDTIIPITLENVIYLGFGEELLVDVAVATGDATSSTSEVCHVIVSGLDITV